MHLKRQITEYLDVDVAKEMWCCHRCGQELISVRKNYKLGCLVYNRDPRTIYNPLMDGPYSFSPDPEWIRVVEFYCPSCGIMIENEFLPPGHPITYDIQLNIDKLKEKYLTAGGGE